MICFTVSARDMNPQRVANMCGKRWRVFVCAFLCVWRSGWISACTGMCFLCVGTSLCVNIYFLPQVLSRTHRLNLTFQYCLTHQTGSESWAQRQRSIPSFPPLSSAIGFNSKFPCSEKIISLPCALWYSCGKLYSLIRWLIGWLIIN